MSTSTKLATFAALTFSLTATSLPAADARIEKQNRISHGLNEQLARMIEQRSARPHSRGDLQLSDQFKARLRVIARGSVSSPRISGDGKTIVWNAFDPEIPATMMYRWVDTAEGGSTERLTPTTHNAMWGDLSYDGKVIVWTAQPKGNESDWDIQRWENGITETVASSPQNEYTLRLSNDGSTIVYDRDRNGKFVAWDIYAIRGKHGTPEPIAAAPNKDEEFPWVSGDGSKIFWREYHRGNNGKGVSDFYRFEGGKRLPTLVTEHSAFLPAMTPDCSKLVFAWSFFDHDQGGIYEMKNLNPKTVRPIADDEGSLQWYPALANDGSMAWSDKKDIEGLGLNIWVSRRGITVPLTTAKDRLLTMPSFSADGRRLVFVDFLEKNDYAVYLVDFLD